MLEEDMLLGTGFPTTGKPVPANQEGIGVQTVGSRETPLEVLVKGALAGLAGALAIRLAMQATLPAPPPGAERPEEPREVLVRKIASGLFEKEMSESERRAWAELVHWWYGAAWGCVYGVVQASLRLPGLIHGLLFGTPVWVAGPRFLLPAMKLTPPPEGETVRQTLMGWGFHALYGIVTATTFALLEMGRRE